jgi:uncharacterized membrane-anchored protein YhcB (DUF1043 family)
MENVSTVLFQYGVAGVAILAEGFVIARLYSDKEKLQLRLEASQEARRQDAVETTDKVLPVMQGFTSTANLLYSKIKTSKEA